MFSKKLRGFTLVEMLIVIVIIGLLAASLIPKITGMQAKARDTVRKADLNNLATAISVYYTDNGGYPTPETNWSVTWWVATGLINYMSSIPRDPTNNRPCGGLVTAAGTNQAYMYSSIARNWLSGQAYVLMACTEEVGAWSNWVYDATNGLVTRLSGMNLWLITSGVDIAWLNSKKCDRTTNAATDVRTCKVLTNVDLKRYIVVSQ